ncbi:TolC family protein [Uliginosibacterium sp. 31-16]|uniref:TolC family protein n=1 Tax=Uliginosibacterium sp. 31-16 TaxID=3068315 RepID=UPI00273F0356|nr:TolC family protein [Uliginosibacterium sp. 31-16]MDP5239475.1 TolC family protein [Uliginosibacterium sp. 31-16]
MRLILSCALATGALFVTPVLAQSPLIQASNSSVGVHAPDTLTVRLTELQAWDLAEKANPALRSKRALLDAAQGERTDAGALLYNNPTLSLERARRQIPSAESPSDRQKEWGANLSQTFEIAGQGTYRRDAADAALNAIQAEIDEAQRQTRADVSQRFFKVLALQKRLEIEAQALSLFESTANAMQKRRAAGEDTRLDANVALVEAERARNQLAQVREELSSARDDLAASLQLPSSSVPEALGELAMKAMPFTLGQLLEQLPSQPRLRALSARVDTASARLKLQRASVYPDLTVGLGVAREGAMDAREKVTMLSVSLPLPLFRRNATGIGQASSDLTQAQIEQQAAVRDSAAQVRGLWVKLQSVEARVKRLQGTVLPALESNQDLAGKSQRAGEIGLLEMIVVTRQTLDARRDLLDAQSDYIITRTALEQAAGVQP